MVIILGLTMAVVLPNFGVTQSALLRNQARELAAVLEYARQRAAMTGHPHRLLVGVDDGLYRVEWFVSEEEASGELDDAPPSSIEPVTAAPIDLSPPTVGRRDYRPIPAQLGADSWLEEGLEFTGVDTPEGWLDSGDVAVVFDRDGTTDAATLEIADEDGRRVALEVRPLLDVVRIGEVEDAG